MAQDKTDGEGSAAGGKRKTALLLVVIGAAVLLAGGAGAWFVFAGHRGEENTQAQAARVLPPKFFTLDPFVVNLAGDEQHYLQVGIDLKVADEAVTGKIKERLPEIRNGVLLLLSAKTAEELMTLDGKNRLREEIRAAVNGPIGIPDAVGPSSPAAGQVVGDAHAAGQDSRTEAHAAPTEGVLDVLLTSFVIQ
jgi:flagellar FliL protein